MTSLSTTRFTVRLFELEFKSDDRGAITAAEIVQAGVRFVRSK